MTAAPLPEPFPATRYLIGGIVRRRLHFPHYAGPALRGAFGHALRQLNCITGHDDCTGCRARTACTYAAVFEPPPPPAMHRPRQRIPPPYVLEPPPGAITLEPGAPFHFGLVLIGPARARLDRVIAALHRALARDFGGGAVELTTVQDESGTRLGKPGGNAPIAPQPAGIVSAPPPRRLDRVALDFVTPICLRRNGADLDPARITARDVLMSAVRRVTDCTELHLGSQVNADFSALSQLAADARCNLALRRLALNRHSTRQRRAIPLDGLIGRIELEGTLAPFWPFLHLAQWLHLGRQTVFGFGRFTLHADPRPDLRGDTRA